MGYQWGISLWHVDTTRVGDQNDELLGGSNITTQSQKGPLLSANWLIVREIIYRWHPWRWWFIMFFNFFYRAVGISAFCPYHYEEILWWFQNIHTKSTWTTEKLLACYHCYWPVICHAAHSDIVIKAIKSHKDNEKCFTRGSLYLMQWSTYFNINTLKYASQCKEIFRIAGLKRKCTNWHWRSLFCSQILKAYRWI